MLRVVVVAACCVALVVCAPHHRVRRHPSHHLRAARDLEVAALSKLEKAHRGDGAGSHHLSELFPSIEEKNFDAVGWGHVAARSQKQNRTVALALDLEQNQLQEDAIAQLFTAISGGADSVAKPQFLQFAEKIVEPRSFELRFLDPEKFPPITDLTTDLQSYNALQQTMPEAAQLSVGGYLRAIEAQFQTCVSAAPITDAVVSRASQTIQNMRFGWALPLSKSEAGTVDSIVTPCHFIRASFIQKGLMDDPTVLKRAGIPLAARSAFCNVANCEGKGEHTMTFDQFTAAVSSLVPEGGKFASDLITAWWALFHVDSRCTGCSELSSPMSTCEWQLAHAFLFRESKSSLAFRADAMFDMFARTSGASTPAELTTMDKQEFGNLVHFGVEPARFTLSRIEHAVAPLPGAGATTAEARTVAAAQAFLKTSGSEGHRYFLIVKNSLDTALHKTGAVKVDALSVLQSILKLIPEAHFSVADGSRFQQLNKMTGDKFIVRHEASTEVVVPMYNLQELWQSSPSDNPDSVSDADSGNTPDLTMIRLAHKAQRTTSSVKYAFELFKRIVCPESAEATDDAVKQMSFGEQELTNFIAAQTRSRQAAEQAKLAMKSLGWTHGAVTWEMFLQHFNGRPLLYRGMDGTDLERVELAFSVGVDNRDFVDADQFALFGACASLWESILPQTATKLDNVPDFDRLQLKPEKTGGWTFADFLLPCSQWMQFQPALREAVSQVYVCGGQNLGLIGPYFPPQDEANDMRKVVSQLRDKLLAVKAPSKALITTEDAAAIGNSVDEIWTAIARGAATATPKQILDWAAHAVVPVFKFVNKGIVGDRLTCSVLERVEGSPPSWTLSFATAKKATQTTCPAGDVVMSKTVAFGQGLAPPTGRWGSTPDEITMEPCPVWICSDELPKARGMYSASGMHAGSPQWKGTHSGTAYTIRRQNVDTETWLWEIVQDFVDEPLLISEALPVSLEKLEMKLAIATRRKQNNPAECKWKVPKQTEEKAALQNSACAVSADTTFSRIIVLPVPAADDTEVPVQHCTSTCARLDCNPTCPTTGAMKVKLATALKLQLTTTDAGSKVKLTCGEQSQVLNSKEFSDSFSRDSIAECEGIAIEVESTSGKKQSYKLQVTAPSRRAELKSLKVGSTTINVNAESQTPQVVALKHNVQQFPIQAEVQDGLCSQVTLEYNDIMLLGQEDSPKLSTSLCTESSAPKGAIAIAIQEGAMLHIRVKVVSEDSIASRIYHVIVARPKCDSRSTDLDSEISGGCYTQTCQTVSQTVNIKLTEDQDPQPVQVSWANTVMQETPFDTCQERGKCWNTACPGSAPMGLCDKPLNLGPAWECLLRLAIDPVGLGTVTAETGKPVTLNAVLAATEFKAKVRVTWSLDGHEITSCTTASLEARRSCTFAIVSSSGGTRVEMVGETTFLYSELESLQIKAEATYVLPDLAWTLETLPSPDTVARHLQMRSSVTESLLGSTQFQISVRREVLAVSSLGGCGGCISRAQENCADALRCEWTAHTTTGCCHVVPGAPFQIVAKVDEQEIVDPTSSYVFAWFVLQSATVITPLQHVVPGTLASYQTSRLVIERHADMLVDSELFAVVYSNCDDKSDVRTCGSHSPFPGAALAKRSPVRVPTIAIQDVPNFDLDRLTSAVAPAEDTSLVGVSLVWRIQPVCTWIVQSGACPQDHIVDSTTNQYRFSPYLLIDRESHPPEPRCYSYGLTAHVPEPQRQEFTVTPTACNQEDTNTRAKALWPSAPVGSAKQMEVAHQAMLKDAGFVRLVPVLNVVLSNTRQQASSGGCAFTSDATIPSCTGIAVSTTNDVINLKAPVSNQQMFIDNFVSSTAQYGPASKRAPKPPVTAKTQWIDVDLKWISGRGAWRRNQGLEHNTATGETGCVKVHVRVGSAEWKVTTNEITVCDPGSHSVPIYHFPPHYPHFFGVGTQRMFDGNYVTEDPSGAPVVQAKAKLAQLATRNEHGTAVTVFSVPTHPPSTEISTMFTINNRLRSLLRVPSNQRSFFEMTTEQYRHAPFCIARRTPAGHPLLAIESDADFHCVRVFSERAGAEVTLGPLCGVTEKCDQARDDDTEPRAVSPNVQLISFLPSALSPPLPDSGDEELVWCERSTRGIKVGDVPKNAAYRAAFWAPAAANKDGQQVGKPFDERLYYKCAGSPQGEIHVERTVA